MQVSWMASRCIMALSELCQVDCIFFVFLLRVVFFVLTLYMYVLVTKAKVCHSLTNYP